MKTDIKLKEALVAQLCFWVGKSASNLQVMVNDGIVTLRGCVPGYAEKKECVEIVRRAGGVKEVDDQVVVEIPETRQCTDAEIAAAAANAINWITTVPLNSIKITVHAGKLILEGVVESRQQKQVVESVVRPLPGIVEITNLITAKPQPLQPEVKAAIESVFERNARLDSSKTDADVTGIKAILRENASSIAERDEAECAA
jgi:osmotically-inducible protein OsmY